MGTYNEVIFGAGLTKHDALADAWNEYVYEHGHRCSYRGTRNARLLRKQPPQKPHVETRNGMTYHSVKPDPNAPPDEWLEVWQFEIDVHS